MLWQALFGSKGFLALKARSKGGGGGNQYCNKIHKPLPRTYKPLGFGKIRSGQDTKRVSSSR